MVMLALLLFRTFQFSTFEYLTKSVWNYLPGSLTTDLRPVTHFVCGGIAGSVATLACQPCDVLRTRFVTQGQQKVSISY